MALGVAVADHQPVTGAGAVPVRAPRVNDKRTEEVTGQGMRFTSSILPAWARKSPQVAEVLPLLYLHGLSSGDFGVDPLSRTPGYYGHGHAAGFSSRCRVSNTAGAI